MEEDPPTPKTPPRVRAKTEPAFVGERVPHLRLCDIAEQRVLKYGVRHLRRRLGPQAAELPLPRRPNGTSKLLKPSFFERLLARKIELQTLMSAEVAEAQPDIRHLCLEHLLIIRDDAADFNTDSKSHEGHSGFLMKIDRHLHELLAKRLEHAESLPEQQRQQLGQLLLLVQGATAVLTGEEPEASTFAVEGPVPRLLLLPLPSSWPQHSALLVHLEDAVRPPALDLEGGYLSATPSTAPSSSSSSPKAKEERRCEDGGGFGLEGLRAQLLPRPLSVEQLEVALEDFCGVVWDRSSGFGKTRRVSWEVAPLPPNAARVMQELQQVDRTAATLAAGVGGSAGINSPLGKELAEELKRRVTMPELRAKIVRVPASL